MRTDKTSQLIADLYNMLKLFSQPLTLAKWAAFRMAIHVLGKKWCGSYRILLNYANPYKTNNDNCQIIIAFATRHYGGSKGYIFPLQLLVTFKFHSIYYYLHVVWLLLWCGTARYNAKLFSLINYEALGRYRLLLWSFPTPACQSFPWSRAYNQITACARGSHGSSHFLN